VRSLPFALVAAVVVAEAAVLLLRPRDGIIAPADVSVAAYFSPAELTRARDFRGPQIWLFGARVLIELGVLVLVLRRPPRLLREARRPVIVGALAGAALSVATAAAALPVAAIGRQRAVDVGLVTQSWTGWAGDVALGWAIGAAIAGAGAAVAVLLVRRLRRTWWLAGAAVIVAFGVTLTFAQPVVLDPLFNRFEPLPAGPARTDVLELAERSGVDVGEVLVMDASRRTTAANAYVAGLGRTKRVVLYDTLLEHFTRDEVRLVVAHELAHVRFRDVPNGLVFLALVAPPALLAVARVGERIGGTVPGLAIAGALVAPLVTTVSLRLSRAIEARADSYALRLTDAPEPFIGFERRIALRNVADPAPARWRTALLATHPPTLERIGIALAYQRGAR
jgi:STE24 endopeptidase